MNIELNFINLKKSDITYNGDYIYVDEYNNEKNLVNSCYIHKEDIFDNKKLHPYVFLDTKEILKVFSDLKNTPNIEIGKEKNFKDITSKYRLVKFNFTHKAITECKIVKFKFISFSIYLIQYINNKYKLENAIYLERITKSNNLILEGTDKKIETKFIDIIKNRLNILYKRILEVIPVKELNFINIKSDNDRKYISIQLFVYNNYICILDIYVFNTKLDGIFPKDIIDTILNKITKEQIIYKLRKSLNFDSWFDVCKDKCITYKL